ncbi:DUF4998 domain-containing protein [Pedobacter caeni]|uniref:F5/8 type C domain-containing protein n=1 Tax=Pedobacter caeni TaxID=288992 RepID=A0A1M5IPU4_9SPHI|nr:DUF4998 domain-containing protein [Pedobacter caeni]SHG30271.1 protein of unknown function [Pedobacter caeni]
MKPSKNNDILMKYMVVCFLVVTVACLSSCAKEDDYKKATKNGEIYYPGRADSVTVYGGNRRVQLRIELGNDPLITKVKAFWNNNADSVEMKVVKKNGKEVVNMLIDNLNQGTYNFSVYTYTSDNARSVVKNTSGMVYGENYLKTLSNRTIKLMALSLDGNKTVIDWNGAIAGEKSIELKYLDNDGLAKTLIIPGGTMKTELSGYQEGSKLTYRSVYLPEVNAIDEFSVGYTEVVLPVFERQADKSKFREYILPGDARDAHGWKMTNLWNEDYNPKGFATTNGIPQWFTFDMGTSVSLSRFKTWQSNDRLYRAENVRKFEIWGSDAPNPDGSWTSWTKLLTCESLKPSGLPGTESNAIDEAYARAGEEFIFPEGLPKLRYIRIKVLETWGGADFMTMAELTFWTKDR